jgi:hypothetical protein
MRIRVVAAGLLVALAAGCGGSKVTPEGKVVTGGKAYSPQSDGDMTVLLSPEAGGGTGYTAKVQPDGSFKVEAPEGGGIPAGKYKIGYTRYPSPSEMAKLKGPPVPKSKETGEVWDVSSGPFTLDVDKAK